MKLLFDENISYRLVRLIADIFPDSQQVKRLGLLRHTDAAIWAYARQHDYCIVTHDEDFAELSSLRGAPPYVLLIRTGNSATLELAGLLRRHALTITETLVAGSETHCLTLF